MVPIFTVGLPLRPFARPSCRFLASASSSLSPCILLKRRLPRHPQIWSDSIKSAHDIRCGAVAIREANEGGKFQQSGPPPIVGYGLYDQKANIPLRVYSWDKKMGGDCRLPSSGLPPQPAAEPPLPEVAIAAILKSLVAASCSRRLPLLRSPSTTAFRCVNSEGDFLSGLVVDKYGTVLSILAHSFPLLQRLPTLLPQLHLLLGTTSHVISAADIRRREGDVSDREVSLALSVARDTPSREPPPTSTVVLEAGVKFEVDFGKAGHKTGLFLDQRPNRIALREVAKGADVLDLCSYSGGFSLNAALGGARSVSAVDLDEMAIKQLKANGERNGIEVDVLPFADKNYDEDVDSAIAQRFGGVARPFRRPAVDIATDSLVPCKIEAVHADAFKFAKRLRRLGAYFDIVVCDPPKFVQFRGENGQAGRDKYVDLNEYAASLVRPGGLLLSCSCSGMVERDEFEALVRRGVERAGKRIKIVERTGAGEDHPCSEIVPELEYLKVIWCKVS